MQERAGCWYLVIGGCLVNGWVQLGVGVWVRGVCVSVCVCDYWLVNGGWVLVVGD